MALMALSSLPVAAPPLGRTEALTLYKGLGRFGQSIFGGHAYWKLPGADAPGAWMPPVDRLSPGAAGYHLARGGDIVRCWLAPRLFVAEGRGASAVVPAGTTVVFQEARLVRELPWDLDAALRFYDACLKHAVAEAGQFGDFVDEARHRRLLADARFLQGDPSWHYAVRLGLSDLATAVGGVWHRAERRRRVSQPQPWRTHVERAQEWQTSRFLAWLGERVPDEKEMTYA